MCKSARVTQLDRPCSICQASILCRSHQYRQPDSQGIPLTFTAPSSVGDFNSCPSNKEYGGITKELASQPRLAALVTAGFVYNTYCICGMFSVENKCE